MENGNDNERLGSLTPSDSTYTSANSGDELSEAFNNQLNIQSTFSLLPLPAPSKSPAPIARSDSFVPAPVPLYSSIISPIKPSPSKQTPTITSNIFSPEQLRTPPAHSISNPIEAINLGPRTAVIFQEACTKHRYIRTNDTASLMSIVERPERIRAIKVGVANAWARLENKKIAEGGKKWEPKEEVINTEDGVDLLDELMSGLGLKDVKGKGKGKEVIGGPFDILISTAVLPVSNPALLYVHPLPNYPPPVEITPYQIPSPPTPTSQLPSTPNNKSTSLLESNASSSAPPKLSRPSLMTPPAWPYQLQKLCRNSTTAINSKPFSEIPLHLPQGDLYLSEGSEEAIFGALGAVCEGVDRIIEGTKDGTKGNGYDRAFVAIRPPGHHCCEDQPMGFCFVNNVAVAAAHAYQKHGVDRVIILDIDLHQGIGTQVIVWRINAAANSAALAVPYTSPRKGSPKKMIPKKREFQVMYGSLHDVFSYPCEDGDPGMIQSASLNLSGGHSQFISNVHLESWTTESDFYERLYPRYLAGLLGAAAEFCQKTTMEGEKHDSNKTMVIISAGFDASEFESAGMSRHRRNVPTSFYHRFSLDAAKFANDYAGGKLLSVLEGGYSDRALASGTLAMMTGLTEAPRRKESEIEVVDGFRTKEENDSWWEEKCLGQIEKACKPLSSKKGGKLISNSSLSYSSIVIGTSTPSPPIRSSSIDSNKLSSEESWLQKTVEIFSIIEGIEINETKEKEKKEKESLLSRTMQLRERRPRGGLSEDSTPVPTPSRKNVRTTSKIIVPELEVIKLVQVVKLEVEEEVVVQTPSIITAPKIKFTFKAGL